MKRALLLCAAMALVAAVKPVSTDGEATVYLYGKFQSTFDVAYLAVLKPGARNKSWTWLNITLLGTKVPGPGAAVGLASSGAGSRAVTPYTYVTDKTLMDKYTALKSDCSNGCDIEMRGDAKNVYAYVDNKKVATWGRSMLALDDPSFQLNAETHGVGDTINASLTPIRLFGAGVTVKKPKCAFTTRGVEPSGQTTLTFHGENKDADGEYVTLATGVHADKC